METKMKRRTLLASIAAAWVGTQHSAWAQSDKQPIRLVVGYPAGGVADFAARTIADGLTQAVGMQTIVENKPGFAGNISLEYVARQPGDSGVYGFFGNSQLSTHPFVPQLASKTVDPFKDVVAIGAVSETILVLAVSTGLGVKTLDEFLIKARQPGQRLRIGLAGVGTAHHFAALLLQREAKLDLLLVPYKGGAPMIVDAAGGHLDAVFTTLPVGGPMVAAGKMRWLAIAQPTSIASLPGIPSLIDVYHGASIPSWSGLFASASTPASQLDLMHGALQKALALPAISQKLRENGLEPLNLTRAQTDARVREDAAFMKDFLTKVPVDFST